MLNLIDKNHFQEACQQILQGKVIIIPTETVYGLVASINFPAAIQSIFNLKGREQNKPFQILVANLSQAEILCTPLSSTQSNIIKNNTPGPFTFLVNKSPAVSSLITANSDKVGLRIPDHPLVLKLIKTVGPLVATSANAAGQPPAINAEQAKAIFPEIFVLPEKETKFQSASAVIDLTRQPIQTIRRGPVELKN